MTQSSSNCCDSCTEHQSMETDNCTVSGHMHHGPRTGTAEFPAEFPCTRHTSQLTQAIMPTHRQSLTAIRARSVRNKSVGTSYHEQDYELCASEEHGLHHAIKGGHTMEILISLSHLKG